jgi:hypothetical protein
MGRRKVNVLTVVVAATIVLSTYLGNSVIALPPPQDTPEEILRTEIIIEARSPIDGKPLDAAQYAELQAQLQTRPTPKLAPEIRQSIFLLRLLKALRTIFPFLKF